MDDILDMSLDDYINSFKAMKDHKANKNIICSEESKFKEGRRQQNDDDELEDELILDCHEDDYVSLAPKKGEMLMVDNGINEPDDLRNKIVGRFPKSSQQWRLMQPNIMNIRPAGMPPLIPSDAPQNSLNGNGNANGNCNGNGNGNRNNRRNYNRNRRNFKNNNWQQNNNNRNNNNNNSNNNNYNNNNNNYNNHNNHNNSINSNSNNFNGRIQRFNSNFRPNLNSKNIKLVLDELKQRNPMILYPSTGTPDLTIESTTCGSSSSFGSPGFSVPNINCPEIKPQTITIESADSTQPSSSTQSKGSEAIKSLLGVNDVATLRNDMLPALAGKLLDILNGAGPTKHKPMYDMKIQKEIHEIQKKPLLYKCPGGEVVSSDGAGIPDCKIQPKVSGISLNNRFA